MSNKATAAKQIRTLRGAHSFLRRLRVSANGTLLENINDYNRTHQMFKMLTSIHNRDNGHIEGFGYRSDAESCKDPVVVHAAASLQGIARQSYQTVGFKLLSGVVNQPKFSPL